MLSRHALVPAPPRRLPRMLERVARAAWRAPFGRFRERGCGAAGRGRGRRGLGGRDVRDLRLRGRTETAPSRGVRTGSFAASRERASDRAEHRGATRVGRRPREAARTEAKRVGRRARASTPTGKAVVSRAVVSRTVVSRTVVSRACGRSFARTPGRELSGELRG